MNTVRGNRWNRCYYKTNSYLYDQNGFKSCTIENSVFASKADDASSLMNMVATTNRMFALDHAGAYAPGQLATSAGQCAPGAVCPAVGRPLEWQARAAACRIDSHCHSRCRKLEPRPRHLRHG